MGLKILNVVARQDGKFTVITPDAEVIVSLNPRHNDIHADDLTAWLRDNQAEGWTPSIADVKAKAIAEMLAWITGFLAPFTAGVPDDEVTSWPRKAEAARLHLAGAPQRMILAEAAITGEAPDVLARTIVAKADAYEAIISTVTGLRRKTEEEINAAISPEQVQAVLTDAKATATKLAATLGAPTPKGA